MAKKKTSRKSRDLTAREKGAAFIAWYERVAEDWGGGAITRAQAAHVLGISQVAVGRLIARGQIRARYFPKEPDVEGLVIGADDPFWLRLGEHLTRLVDRPGGVEWVQACYVSLADVKRLWEAGEAREKSRLHWGKFWGRVPMDGPVMHPGPHASAGSKSGAKSSGRHTKA